MANELEHLQLTVGQRFNEQPGVRFPAAGHLGEDFGASFSLR